MVGCGNLGVYIVDCFVCVEGLIVRVLRRVCNCRHCAEALSTVHTHIRTYIYIFCVPLLPTLRVDYLHHTHPAPPAIRRSTYTMAPALTTSAPTAPHELSSFPNHKAPRNIYPDGIKTSGQHPPLYDILRPYEDFPQKITGPTVWNVEDYRSTCCISSLPPSIRVSQSGSS